MDALIGGLIGAAADIFQTAISPVVRQFQYYIKYKTYIETLGKKMDDLNYTRMDVELRVGRAKRNLESIRIPVGFWLAKVSKETDRCAIVFGLMNGDEAAKVLVKRFSYNRYTVGKEAFKKIKLFDELIYEGKSFESVSDSFSTLDVINELLPAMNQNIVDLPSREFTMNQVMTALKTDGTYSVGVYGMGGVGKSTMMKQLWRQVIQEKLFDVVVMITLSENTDVEKIQADIANQLGLTKLQEVSENWKRIEMLSERVIQEKCVLVILEDLWISDINLKDDVGIPWGKNNTGFVCKVVITTRDVDICLNFRASNCFPSQPNIEVGILSKEDSTCLFMKNVGNVGDSPDLQKVAGEIVEECNGLPLALVTLGRAMINKPMPVWKDAAFHLKRSNLTMLGGTLSKVFFSIELSYHHLENDILKKCFLYCCLFHKNCQIDIDQLVMYVISDEMIVADLNTLNEVRGRVQTVVDKLINSCLLLSYTKKNNGIVSTVTMHGVVRDVAIKISERSGFFVFADSDLGHWPDWKMIRNCSRVSLVRNNIGLLPEEPPELPHLLVLSLQQNQLLTRIPDGFFSSMDALVSLDISKTGIYSLPSSLSCLKNLQSLCLDYCYFPDPENLLILRNLIKLEILSLVECCLSGLPNEIGELKNLKSLDLSNNYNLIIPPNVISRLYCLEELYTMNSFRQWEVEGRSHGHCASLEEVAYRTSLKTLHVMKENEKGALMLCISMGWQASRKYYAQNYNGIPEQFECSLNAASPPFGQSIKMLLARVGNLILSECSGLLTMGELVTYHGFPKMRALLVVNCLDMEFLMSFSVKMIAKSTFIALEKLYLHLLSNLKGITHGPMPADLFDKLKLMELIECEELVSLFSADTLVKFESLEVLRVEKCGKLTEVSFLGNGAFGKENEWSVTFPNLSEIYLKELPKLMTIWKGVGSIENLGKLKIMEVKSCDLLKYLFTSTTVISLQQLERLEIDNCRSMVSIVSSDKNVPLPPQMFSSLRELIVKQCHSLKDLYPLTKLFRGGRLSKLQLLEVNDCGRLEEILQVNQDEQNNFNEEKYVFPQLEQLFLYKLPSLKAICNGTIPNGSFKKLRKFGISNCGNLTDLCFPIRLVLYGGLSILEYISVVGCNSLESIIYDDNEHTGQKPSHQEILPQLTEFILRALPNLEMIVRGVRMSSKSFENLKKLSVVDCNSMKHLLPTILLGPGGLPKLEHVYLADCNKMESIFYDDHHGGKKVKSTAEQKLVEQQLDRLSKLINVHPAVQTSLQWPCLETIVVKNCGNLKELEWEGQQSKTLSQRLLKNSGEGTSSGTKGQ